MIEWLIIGELVVAGTFHSAACWRRAAFRMPSAIENAASFAQVLFAMSVSPPSGRRTRHIFGHQGWQCRGVGCGGALSLVGSSLGP
jgi:hypothetical protein